MISLASRVRGALLGLATGDALGAPLEFLSPEVARSRFGHLTEMVGNQTWAPGEWTDDTAMALGIARGILRHPADPCPEAGRLWVRWEGNAKDVGSTIRAAISGFKRDEDWVMASRQTPQAREGKAAGNGSLMRTLPVALGYPLGEEMLRQSARLSAMTHWDAQAEVCCGIYNFWIAYLLAEMPARAAYDLALRHARALPYFGFETPGPSPLPFGFWQRLAAAPDLEYNKLQPSGYAGYAVECLEAAVWCVLNCENYEDAMIKCVNLAGEADTMAAIAGGAAGALWGEEAIPSRWLDQLLERELIGNLADALLELREHLAIYTTPDLPPFEMEWLDRRIAAGRNPLSVRDVASLRASGITHVLDLREEAEWTLPRFGGQAIDAMARLGIQRMHLPVKDMGAPDALDLDRAVAWIEKALAQGNARVFLHCRAGMERTAAVAIAFWVAREGISYDAAFRNLRGKRAIFQPLPAQERAVKEWMAGRK